MCVFCLCILINLLKLIDHRRVSSYRPMVGEVGGRGRGNQQNPFLGPRKLRKQFLAMSDFYFYFYFFSPRTLNLFTLHGIYQNRSNSANRLSLAKD